MEEKEVKLDQGIVDKLRKMLEEYDNLIFRLGSAEAELLKLSNVKSEIVSQINHLQAEENELYTNLRKMLGDGTIDLKKGTFTPQKTEKSEV